MSRKYYMLDKDRNVVETDDVIEWAAWFGDTNRRVAYAAIGEYRVSTGFLGLDHNFTDDSGPVLFETMVFKKEGDGSASYEDVYTDRYRTWEEAEAGHAKVCKLLEAGELELYSNE